MSDISIEIQSQVERVKQSEASWENADPLHEEWRWLEYQAQKARLEALHMEASGKVERAGFVLPWLQRGVGA